MFTTLPFEQARAVYDREPCARSFNEDLEAHFLNGVVASNKLYFVMMRKVNVEWSDKKIVNPFYETQPSDFANCWHVYLMAGSMKWLFHDLLKIYPSYSWVSYERRNVLKRRKLRTMLERLS